MAKRPFWTETKDNSTMFVNFKVSIFPSIINLCINKLINKYILIKIKVAIRD